MTGLIKSYNATKGYGFITPLIGKPDTTAPVFFHVTSVLGRVPGEQTILPSGAEVTFEVVRGEKGPQAMNVRVKKLSGDALWDTLWKIRTKIKKEDKTERD